MRDEIVCTIQPGIFFLGRTFVHDEQRLPRGHPHAQHPAAFRRKRLRRLFPARHRQIQPRRPAGRRSRFLDRDPHESGLHAGLHLPRHHPLAAGQLRRRAAGLPRSHRAASRPAGTLLQPRRHASFEPAVHRGHRRFRQVHPSGEQGRRRLYLPRPELPASQGHGPRLRQFQHRHPHQPREPQRLQPPGRSLHGAEALSRSRSRLQQGDRVRLDLPAVILQPGAGLLEHQPPDAGLVGLRQGDPARFDQLADLLQPRHAAHADRRLQPRTGGLRQSGALFAQQRAGILQPRGRIRPAGRDRKSRRGLHLGHQALSRLRQRLYTAAACASCCATRRAPRRTATRRRRKSRNTARA